MKDLTSDIIENNKKYFNESDGMHNGSLDFPSLKLTFITENKELFNLIKDASLNKDDLFSFSETNGKYKVESKNESMHFNNSEFQEEKHKQMRTFTNDLIVQPLFKNKSINYDEQKKLTSDIENKIVHKSLLKWVTSKLTSSKPNNDNNLTHK